MTLKLTQDSWEFTFDQFRIEGALAKEVHVRKSGRNPLPRVQDDRRCEYHFHVIAWLKDDGTKDEWEKMWGLSDKLQQEGGIFTLEWGDPMYVHTRNVVCRSFNWWHTDRGEIEFHAVFVESKT